MKLNEKIIEMSQSLRSVEPQDPRRAARLIVKYVLGLDEARQMAEPGYPLDLPEIERLDRMVARRMKGEPLSRILGRREFYSLPFNLSPATLDPRPETELLVDQAINWIQAQAGDRPLSLLDLGTGTGCIPIAVLKNCPMVRAVAVDVSPEALAVAWVNADQQGVGDRLALIQSDWFSALFDVSFDLIVSNPPYIPEEEIGDLAADVRDFDPILALAGGADGLDPYRRIFSTLAQYLNPGGIGLFEIGAGQWNDITQLARDSGLDVAGVWEDYAGIPRVIGVTVHRP